MKNDTILKVSKLEVVYNHVSTAVQGVSFNLLRGQIFSIIGANGAGKTTTLRAISGFLGVDNAAITDGEVYFEGERLNGLSPHKISKRGLVLVPERVKTFDTLTVEENLGVSISRQANRIEREEMEQKIYQYFPSLCDLRHHLVGYMSGGEKQMLAIGQALLCFPKILMLDEVSMGLAPIVVSKLFDTLKVMSKDLGLTLLIVEQNAAIALNISDYTAVMENGRIVFDGISKELLTHKDVREFYLGLHETCESDYQDVKQYRRTRRWY